MNAGVMPSLLLLAGVEPKAPATLRDTRDRAPRRVPRSSIRSSSPPQSHPHQQYIPFAMSITEIEDRCNILRNDLKIWEKQFAAQNGGRKAGRDDIKANLEICTHATHHPAGTIKLTGDSQQIQRIQQATGQVDRLSRAANSLETKSNPESFYARYRANAQGAAQIPNFDPVEKKTSRGACG